MAGLWLALACGSAARAVTPAMDWTVKYSQTTGGSEHYLASANDPAGNTYLVYENPSFQVFISVIDPTGATTATFPITTAGLVLAAAYDPGTGGHLVLAGAVFNALNGVDNIYAERYDLAGNLQWSRSVDAATFQISTGVAVDSAGNVDLAGQDLSSSPGVLLAIQIDAAGDPPTWQQSISNGFADYGQGVTVDGADNVYVTGLGYISPDGAFEPILAAYQSNGTPIYNTHYLTTFQGYGEAVATSGSNVYVGVQDGDQNLAIVQADLATGALTASVWFADANQKNIGSMAVDSAGNIAVAGSTSTNGGDVLGLLYDNTLTPVGSFPITWDSGGTDAAQIAAVVPPSVHVGADGSGNLYFASLVIPPGTCQSVMENVGVLKYANTGAQTWAVVFDPPTVTTAGVVTDGAGSYYVAMAYGITAAVLKYDPAGNLIWRSNFTSPTLCPSGVGGIAYGNGNIYLAVEGGRVPGPGAGVEVGKFNAAGAQTGDYPWDVSTDEYGPKITADAVGNVYLALSTTTFGISAAKMTSLGAISWSYNQQFSPADIVTAIGLDPGNAVYVAGPYPNNLPGYSTERILRLSAGGAFSWTVTIGGVMGQNVTPLAERSALFPAGIYVAGYEDDGAGNLYGRLDRLSTAGAIIWTATAGGSPSEVWNGVTTGDCASDVFVTGSRADLVNGGFDQVLRTYGATGSAGWATVYDNGVTNETGEGVAVGSVYVAGNTGTTGVRLTKYTDTNLRALTGSIAFKPNPAEAWQWVRVTMTVTNTAAETINNLSPWISFNGGPAQYVSGPVPASVGSLAQCAAATFTWTFTATGFGTARFTTTVTALGALSSSVIVEAAVGSVVVVPPAKLSASIWVSPNPIFAGNVVTVSVTVSNTGGIDAGGVVAALGEASGSVLVAAVSGPLPPGPATIAAGTSTTFVWTFTATGTGVVRFSVTANGADLGSLLPLTTQGATAATIFGTAGLAVALAASNNPASVGQVVRVNLTVSNTGSTTAVAVSSTMLIASGAGLVGLISGPVPSGTLVIQAGASTVFVWTYTTTGVGTVDFSATAAGLDAGILGLPLLSATAMTLVIGSPAVLQAALAMTSSSLVVGQTLTVALTITNVGGANALNLVPRLQINLGATSVTGWSGPVPPAIPALPPGSSTTIVWTYTATAKGFVVMSATATGTDAFAGPVAAGSSASASVYNQGRLFLSVNVPLVAEVGLTYTLTATVVNTGDDDVTNVLPLGGFFSGGSLVNFLTSPPLVPVTLSPGSTTIYAWDIQALACGTPQIGAVATGLDALTGSTVYSYSLSLYSYPVSQLAPSTLSASLMWVTSPSGTRLSTGALVVREGETFTVNLRLTNTACGADIDGLGTSRLAWSGTTGGVARAGGPGSPVTLSGGGAKTFRWTYQAVAANMSTGYAFGATLTGTDANFGGPPVAGADLSVSGTMLVVAASTFAVTATVFGISTSVFVEPAASVSMWAATSSAAVNAGQPFQLSVTVSNTGDAPATGVTPAIVPASLNGALVQAGPSPAPGVSIAPHATVTFTWTILPATGGAVAPQVTLVATDGGPMAALLGCATCYLDATGATSVTAPAVTVTARPAGDFVIYPNPVNGDTFHCYLKLNADAIAVTVDVYDAAIHRVFAGAWGFVAQTDGVVDLDGVRKWAPGVYLVRARATLADGSTQTFPSGKVVIKR